MHRIAVLHVITKLELGGAQKQLLSLLGRLDKERFNPFLFTARDGILGAEALAISGLKVERSIFLERPINPLRDILALIEVYFFIRKNNIQIVHTHSSKAGILGRLAARLARAKLIIHTVHGWSFNDYQPALFRKLIILLEKFAAQFTDILVVVSHHDKQKGLKNHIGREEKYTLIRYGIDYEEFDRRRPDIKKELGIDSGDLVVANISCFKPQKSPLDFVRLAYLVKQSIPGVKFLLIGDGLLRKRIERAILRFNIQERMILTGWRRDIPDILSTVDVFVLTSLWEGLPLAALEALASSRPVIATNTGGISEVVIEGENGFLVSPGDEKGMCEKLIALLRDKSTREKMSEKTKEALPQDFLLDNMIGRTQSLYENLFYNKKMINAH